MVRKRKMWELHVDVSLKCDDANMVENVRESFLWASQSSAIDFLNMTFIVQGGETFFVLEKRFFVAR